MFGLFDKVRSGAVRSSLRLQIEEGGLTYAPTGALAGSPATDWLAQADAFDDWQLAYYLAQLNQEGWGPPLDDRFILPWNSLYLLQQHPGHTSSLSLLRLPPDCPLVPALEAQGSLADRDFAIALAWEDARGNIVAEARRLGGAMQVAGSTFLLSGAAWELAEGVRAFARREDRTGDGNRAEWGRLRALAQKAGANLDDFLAKTTILSLDRLDLGLKLIDVQGTAVVEIEPTADGAPQEAWLAAFDRHSRVQDHYDLALDDGTLMRVIPDEDVKEVLREVRQMPARRVAGRRAQTFLRNPYALLGASTAKVLPPERFEALRRQAGIHFLSFEVEPDRDELGRVRHVDVALIPEDETADAPPPIHLQDKAALLAFAKKLGKAAQAGEPCFNWAGRDLDLRGNTVEQLAKLSGLAADCWLSAQPGLDAAEVLDLSRYSARIVGIDVYKPVYSPFIQKTENGGSWLPEEVQPIITWQPPGAAAPVHFTISSAQLYELRAKLQASESRGEDALEMPDWPGPVGVADAHAILEAYQPLLESNNDVTSPGLQEDAPAFYPMASTQPKQRAATVQLLIGENIDNSDYAEERGRLLAFEPSTAPDLPRSLSGTVRMKPHQLTGVAWLQHLWGFSAQVRGCVFADDMGLGKTLQLLTFIHWYLEGGGDPLPVLIVAPVSLLENWKNEIAKFFVPDASRVLTLYGRDLDAVKLEKNAIDPELLAKGLVRFLRPGWRGDAQIVLTTYETLRDQELSLAAERWSIMVCDEAQRIKTPNALVTRAAKKQNVRFRIACTGTPVENSLTDLWCLFDFVQPGLLSPLNEFAKRYVRPIEARTDEERARVEELRMLIAPQILRRTKAEVADLKPKFEEVRRLDISQKQVALYASAVEALKAKQAKGAADGTRTVGAALLSMLHSLRMICADPFHPGLGAPANLPLPEHRRHSPKMDWLLKHLDTIRGRGEKAIVFTEFRDLQRLLQRSIGLHFAIPVTVINGDTKVQTAGEAATRQRLIDAFQSKPGFNVIVLSTTAIGFGVNIQAANHVIHFTRPWNPAKEDQATDRAYRIGQDKEVFVHYPTVMASNFTTFEEKLSALLQAKRRLAGDMLNGCDDVQAADFADLDDPSGGSFMAAQLVTAEQLGQIDPQMFERLCERLWLKQGYSVYRTPKSGDGGVDLVAFKEGTGYLIQCKTTATPKALGWAGVKDVIAGATAYKLKHAGVSFQLAAATNASFNDTARQQAKINGVELYELDYLTELLATYPVNITELL